MLRFFWFLRLPRWACLELLIVAIPLAVVCQTAAPGGDCLEADSRKGDEIVAAGRFFHTGARVVLWMDPGGYDAYRVERRFAPLEKSGWEESRVEAKDILSPNRYNLRKGNLTPEEIEGVRGGGWDLPTLQKVVDQFVIHYDGCGTSRQCFKVLHDIRGLSVHFLLDIDGTIYQTLDLKERAWHATSSNSRSVGVEIANIGAFAPGNEKGLNDWYFKDEAGRAEIVLPESYGDGGLRTAGFVGYSARPQPVSDLVQGREYLQYDFTPQQYTALIQLTVALCRIFPNLKCGAPRNESGCVSSEKLPDPELQAFQGVLGHLHIQSEKIDPGPAFQWEYLLLEAQKRLNEVGNPLTLRDTSLGHVRTER